MSEKTEVKKTDKAPEVAAPVTPVAAKGPRPLTEADLGNQEGWVEVSGGAEGYWSPEADQVLHCTVDNVKIIPTALDKTAILYMVTLLSPALMTDGDTGEIQAAPKGTRLSVIEKAMLSELRECIGEEIKVVYQGKQKNKTNGFSRHVFRVIRREENVRRQMQPARTVRALPPAGVKLEDWEKANARVHEGQLE